MSGEWIRIDSIPGTTTVRREDGTESVEPLRDPRDGELVVRVLRPWKSSGCAPGGAVVEVVAAQEHDELVVGDRLVAFDRASCGMCETCRRGHASLCPDAARIFVPSFEAGYIVLPSWIARRGRVRLPQTLSDDAASLLGRNAWLLRALRLHGVDNPLRILVLGCGDSEMFLGALLESVWPDARRVLRGDHPVEGFHAVETTVDRLRDALGEPADLVLTLVDVDGRELQPLVAPGGRIVLAGTAKLGNPEALWLREAATVSSQGAVSGDMEAWRRFFEAFSSRWDGAGQAVVGG